MSIFQLPPSRCPCKEFLISWFLPPNNLGGKKSVKFFWKCKFRVYNAVSSLGIGVRKRVTRYNWHGIKSHAVSICHFSSMAKNQLHARCPREVTGSRRQTPRVQRDVGTVGWGPGAWVRVVLGQTLNRHHFSLFVFMCMLILWRSSIS